MPNGGKLILETGSTYLDENYANLHGDVRPGRYALIAVSDTGTGIPAAILDKVFNPFFTSKGPGKGTGLGLSMVYGFVKQSAGHIKIYSEEGHGTTIKMYLPPGTGAAVASETAFVSAVQGGHETNPRRRRRQAGEGLCADAIALAGLCHAGCGQCGGSARLVEAGHEFDLLFTDVIMPGAMNGRQLATELQNVQARTKGAVHLGLHRKCDHPSRPARHRRAAIGKALSQIGSGPHDPQGARGLRARTATKAALALGILLTLPVTLGFTSPAMGQPIALAKKQSEALNAYKAQSANSVDPGRAARARSIRSAASEPAGTSALPCAHRRDEHIQGTHRCRSVPNRKAQ